MITIADLKMAVTQKDFDGEKLCKVRLSTPGVIMESVWAKPLGDDMYQLKNNSLHGFEYDEIIHAPVKHGIPTHSRVSNYSNPISKIRAF